MAGTGETDADVAGRAIARWLAPYLADELRKVGFPVRLAKARRALDPRYDRETCDEYVMALGDVVLENAESFFALLAVEGDVDSLSLARALDVDGPRRIPSILTTPLKKRSRRLELPNPWIEGETAAGRVLWCDRDGVAERMTAAIERERSRRNPATPQGTP